jgi:signal transduction histidine kinase
MGQAVLPALSPLWKRPPLAAGVVVAVLCVTAETVFAGLLPRTPGAYPVSVAYLPGLVVVAALWGLWLGLATALASVVAFELFAAAAAGRVRPSAAEFLAALMTFVLVALLGAALAELARRLRAEADARAEADLTADLSRVLLCAPDPRTALPAASRRLAEALALPSASIEWGPVAGDERHLALPLGSDGMPATLLVPAGLSRSVLRRLRERVLPRLSAVLQAAHARETTPDAPWVSRDTLRRIADEQAALRHLATLVARAVPPSEVLDAIAREMGTFLGARRTVLARYEPNGLVSAVGQWNYDDIVPAGSQWPIEKGTVSDLVLRTGAPGRVEAYEGGDELSKTLRAHGIVSSVGCPIRVGRSLWGVAIVSSCTDEKLPADTEERMHDFVEIAVAAIANAQSHADLMASRARVVAATDQTRRRIERDLHDGTQQRLVAIVLELRSVQTVLPVGERQVKDRLESTAHALEEAVTDLQEIARGLHPLILAKGGLEQALNALARRAPLPVKLSMSVGRRLDEPYEVTVYYLVSEALTNAAKHAHATVVHVTLAIGDDGIRLAIEDDGAGGAEPARGSGLTGLIDRVEALGGTLKITSAAGSGTTLLAEIPIVDVRAAGTEPPALP